MSLFESNLRKQVRKLPKNLKSVIIIHYYLLLFIRVLSRARVLQLREEAIGEPDVPRKRQRLAGRHGAGVAQNEAVRTRCVRRIRVSFHSHLADLYAESGQTLQGSFSAGWLALGSIEAKLCK